MTPSIDAEYDNLAKSLPMHWMTYWNLWIIWNYIDPYTWGIVGSSATGERGSGESFMSTNLIFVSLMQEQEQEQKRSPDYILLILMQEVAEILL